MTNLELLLSAKGEVGLWLAGIAACAGLALAWRWWIARRSMQNRALSVLGYARPSQSTLAMGLRYAGVLGVAVLTTLLLAPAAPGAGDTEQAPEASMPALPVSTPALVIIELVSDGMSIVVHGGSVEIRLAPSQRTPVVTVSSGHQSVDETTPFALATPPATDLPVGME